MKWVPGQITNRRVWSDGLFTLTIKANGVQPFEPGQFLQIGFEQADSHLHRPYSVASPHGENLEFFIVRVDGGALTPKLWEMKVGDSIDVSQRAAGSFTLKHAPDAECLWLVGTGTGLAPYIAMLRTPSTWERFRRIVIVHGVRYGTDLAYQSEMDHYRDTYQDRFSYIAAVSRENVDGALTGRITSLLTNGSLEERAQCCIKPDNSAIFLCGNPDMLDEMESILGGRGLTRNRPKNPGQIVVERYW